MGDLEIWLEKNSMVRKESCRRSLCVCYYQLLLSLEDQSRHEEELVLSRNRKFEGRPWRDSNVL